MKIKQYEPRMEELKREGKTNREIAADHLIISLVLPILIQRIANVGRKR